jgi:hypothetical protein
MREKRQQVYKLWRCYELYIPANKITQEVGRSNASEAVGGTGDLLDAGSVNRKRWELTRSKGGESQSGNGEDDSGLHFD